MYTCVYVGMGHSVTHRQAGPNFVVVNRCGRRCRCHISIPFETSVQTSNVTGVQCTVLWHGDTAESLRPRLPSSAVWLCRCHENEKRLCRTQMSVPWWLIAWWRIPRWRMVLLMRLHLQSANLQAPRFLCGSTGGPHPRTGRFALKHCLAGFAWTLSHLVFFGG